MHNEIKNMKKKNREIISEGKKSLKYWLRNVETKDIVTGFMQCKENWNFLNSDSKFYQSVNKKKIEQPEMHLKQEISRGKCEKKETTDKLKS